MIPRGAKRTTGDQQTLHHDRLAGKYPASQGAQICSPRGPRKRRREEKQESQGDRHTSLDHFDGYSINHSQINGSRWNYVSMMITLQEGITEELEESQHLKRNGTGWKRPPILCSEGSRVSPHLVLSLAVIYLLFFFFFFLVQLFGTSATVPLYKTITTGIPQLMQRTHSRYPLQSTAPAGESVSSKSDIGSRDTVPHRGVR